jgi:condensin-2 complex subunit G2
LGYIPLSALKQILQYLVCTLSHDVSSPGVRASVFTGLGEILLNPLSHEILKTLLPLLANSLHDTSEKVRLAFIKMLIQVKSTETIKFYEIVSEENLLLRFSVDSRKSNIATALTELLLNSYFPIQDKESNTYNPAEEKAEQIRRCLIFIKKQSNASSAFYSKLYLFSSVGTVARFSALLFSYLLDNDSGILLSEETMNDENEDKNKNGQHPLMLRAKRRRATEVVLSIYTYFYYMCI